MRGSRSPVAADVVVVGGGASGLLTAVHILRRTRSPMRLVLLEPREHVGAGIAWSSREPTHLLNVPACRMSGIPARPHDFADWAGCERTDFLPRSTYAAYLRDLLDRSVATAPQGSAVAHVRARAVNVAERRVHLDTGEEMAAGRVVLAVGHDAPELPEDLQIDPGARRSIVPDPWEAAALDSVERGETVVCIGTGLTFVDVALTVLARGLATRVVGVSRTGQTPLAHEDPWREPGPSPDFAEVLTPADVAQWVDSHGEDWRRAVDALRPVTPRLWRRWDDGAKREFIQHWARGWEVHRHRMAPGVGRVFGRLVRSGRVSVLGGGIRAVRRDADRLEVVLGSGDVVTADRVVLCTGPTGRADRSPLLAGLIRSGLALPGPLGLGLRAQVDTGAVHHADGTVSGWLFALGPVLRGELWETTAIPEISRQAEAVAGAVAHHHVREEAR